MRQVRCNGQRARGETAGRIDCLISSKGAVKVFIINKKMTLAREGDLGLVVYGSL